MSSPARQTFQVGRAFAVFAHAVLPIRNRTSRRRLTARSSTSTWTPSTRRSSSAIIRTCAASPSPSAAPANAASLRPRATRPAIRRALGDAVGHREAPGAPSDLRHRVSRPTGGLAADPRHLRGIHAADRAAVARRGLSRRQRRTSRAFRERRDVARRIREKFKAKSSLTASASVSYNKFLAKLASDYRKPNGQYVIAPDMGPAFVEALPVGKFHRLAMWFRQASPSGP